ncbi:MULTISPECIES: hypothetical protein [unclassified Streptomyces]|uniref:hypothetical protein n=1 Tax=unclassified Streptomyces TaxID=2593676 RepID=UPI002254B7FE|nr:MULTISPECIES: hypothetical protein [unclassified Streptomyces]MCX4969468.1 hypothetical protein [Streptomyces sp. NBC_00654]MEE1739667.1 hypothetical protein [Streptomyces sp. BE147]
MNHAIARLLEPVLRLLIPARHQRHQRHQWHPLDTCAYVHPYSCDYVGGPTVFRTGERPPRGEDSPLVRPYFVAYEREQAEALVAEQRRRRVRRGGLLVAVRGVEITPEPLRRVEAAA